MLSLVNDEVYMLPREALGGTAYAWMSYVWWSLAMTVRDWS